VCDFVYQLFRLLHLTFVDNFRHTCTISVQIILLFVFVSTFFTYDMAKATDCVPIPTNVTSSKNGTLPNANNSSDWDNGATTTCVKSQLDENILLHENGAYLSYSLVFAGFIIMGICTVYFSPIVKVFRNEHRNRELSVDAINQ